MRFEPSSGAPPSPPHQPMDQDVGDDLGRVVVGPQGPMALSRTCGWPAPALRRPPGATAGYAGDLPLPCGGYTAPARRCSRQHKPQSAPRSQGDHGGGPLKSPFNLQYS